MPSFAPVYRVPASHQSFLTREQKRDRKRKRSANNSDQDETDEQFPPAKLEDEDEPRVPHPVNKKDRYYVAGWPREKPLPGGNFPHAALKDVSQEPLSVEAELARSNPPIYAPKQISDESKGSLRRRHLDNLTSILHKCMLNQDWQRASRVWGLILRTDLDGNGPDIRQHGRWMICAELLMRQHQTLKIQTQTGGHDDDEPQASVAQAVIADEGFALAREYYERLILQYPHRYNTPDSAFSARVVYPALFNVWIYETQGRSIRAQRTISASHDASETQDGHSYISESQRGLRQIKSNELEEAMPIAHRLDELLLSPPYDNMPELLEMRAMVSLWVADLQKFLAQRNVPSNGGPSDDEHNPDAEVPHGQHELHAEHEREKARQILQKMVTAGMEVSEVSRAMLEEDQSAIDDSRDRRNDFQVYLTMHSHLADRQSDASPARSDSLTPPRRS